MSCNPNDFKANRPEPLPELNDAFGADKFTHPEDAAVLLTEGEFVILEDNYPLGMEILLALKRRIYGREKSSGFGEDRKKRTLFHDASNRLIVPIENNRIALRKAPDIGWLEMLYCDMSNFLVPMPKIQGMNSSWQWYLKGIKYPMLDFHIRPYYGVYFPTRFEHLDLFDKWVKRYKGEKNEAIDIGAGCGILTFILLNQGFKRVYASDTNPNALISVCKTAGDMKLSEQINLSQADLFEQCPVKSDMIVFNPPWLPAQDNLDGIDTAIYYQDKSFFDRFFCEAKIHLKPGGTILFLFSNFAVQNKLTEYHPVIHELEYGNRFVKSKLIKAKVKKASRTTKRSDWRKDEYVELWVLNHKQ